MFEQTKRQDINGLNLDDSVYLSREEYAALSTAVVEAEEQALTLLDLFPIEQVPATKKQYKYTTLNKYGAAEVTKVPSDFPALTLTGTEATVAIPLKGISFTLQKDDIAESKRLGEKLDVAYARVAGEKVKKLQDECLYTKSTMFGTLGAHGQATGAFSGTNWSTNTTDVFDQIRQAIAAIPVAYQQEQLRLVLHNTQWSELFRSNWNNGSVNEQVSGGTFMAKIRAAYPGLKIVQSQWVTAAAGLLFPFNPNVARRIVAISTRLVELDENVFEIKTAAMGKDVLVAPTPTALVAITGI